VQQTYTIAAKKLATTYVEVDTTTTLCSQMTQKETKSEIF